MFIDNERIILLNIYIITEDENGNITDIDCKENL